MARDLTVQVRLEAKVAQYVAAMGQAWGATKALGDQIDHTNDRTAWMAQSLLAVGPALVPIGAVAVPAITTLATQMGIAAAAAGVGMLAFNGVGDSLKALNAYQLEPTAENFAKLTEEFNKLGPAGVDFVMFLDQTAGQLESLQRIAGAGVFPGLEQGITEMMARLPEVKQVVGDIAMGMGELSVEAGQALGGSEFDAFFDFLERSARPLLEDMGRTIGNFVKGLADMAVAFEPLTMEFSNGFLEMSRSFAEWAEGLRSSTGFQDFIEYIEASLPKVGDLVGSIVNAFVQLVEAAAPVGDKLLPAFTKFFDMIAAVADTPLGPLLIGMGSLIGLWGRFRALADVTTGGVTGKLLGFEGGVMATSKAAKSAIPTLSQFGTAIAGAGQKASLQSEKLQSANKAVGGFVRAAAPGAAAIGLLALSMSSLDDSAGLANSSMLALTGLMIKGPWGAAAGATVGFFMDMSEAGEKAAAAFDQANLSLTNLDFGSAGVELQRASAATDELLASIERGNAEGWFSFDNMDDQWAGIVDFFAGTGDAARQAEIDTRYAMESMIHNTNLLADSLQGDDGDPRLLDMTTDELTAFANDIAPAAANAGIDLQHVLETGIGLPELESAVRSYNAEQDSLAGRTGGVADALNGLKGHMLDTATSADQLAASLEALFGPGLNAEEAVDAATQALREMGDILEGNTKTFQGNTKAAIENRAATRDAFRVQAEALTARAANGAGAREMAEALGQSREAFIKEGVAAGFSRDQMEARANEMGLTPKFVRTIFQQVGLEKGRVDIKQLRADIEKMPKQVQTTLETNGYELSSRQVDQLTRKYHLTPKEVLTLLRATDNSSRLIDAVQGRADRLDHTDPSSRLQAQDLASGLIAQVATRLRSLDGNRADTYIYTHDVHIIENRRGGSTSSLGGRTATGAASADGNLFLFADGGFPPIGAQQPQIRPYQGPAGLTWSELGSGPWEAFISGHPAKQDRSRAIATEVVARLGGQTFFASGGIRGTASATASSGTSAQAVSVNFNGTVNTTDVNELARVTEQRQRDALALARS